MLSYLPRINVLIPRKKHFLNLFFPLKVSEFVFYSDINYQLLQYYKKIIADVLFPLSETRIMQLSTHQFSETD